MNLIVVLLALVIVIWLLGNRLACEPDHRPLSITARVQSSRNYLRPSVFLLCAEAVEDAS
jgi:hypothetical protein